MLTERRMLGFFKKISKSIRKAVAKVVKPVVNVIRKSGPLIGAAAGFVAGGLICGPACAVTGLKIGMKVGLGAQAAIKACVPKDTSKIHCTAESVTNVAKDLAISAAIGEVCSKTICPSISASIDTKLVSVAKFIFTK